jgi:hypothetical protein
MNDPQKAFDEGSMTFREAVEAMLEDMRKRTVQRLTVALFVARANMVAAHAANQLQEVKRLIATEAEIIEELRRVDPELVAKWEEQERKAAEGVPGAVSVPR